MLCRCCKVLVILATGLLGKELSNKNLCDEVKVENNVSTCVIEHKEKKKTRKLGKWDFPLTYEGNVNITSAGAIEGNSGAYFDLRVKGVLTLNSKAKLTSRGGMSIQATTIDITGESIVEASSRIKVNAEAVHLDNKSVMRSTAGHVTVDGCSKKNGSAVTISGGSLVEAFVKGFGKDSKVRLVTKSLTLDHMGTLVAGGSIDINCRFGNVTQSRSSTIHAGESVRIACRSGRVHLANGSNINMTNMYIPGSGMNTIVSITAHDVVLETSTELFADEINIQASGDANVSCAFPGVHKSRMSNLSMLVERHAKLGQDNGNSWILKELRVVAADITLTQSQAIITHGQDGTYCGNKNSVSEDLCKIMLDDIEKMKNTSKWPIPVHRYKLLPATASVSFDFIVVASKTLVIQGSARVDASSLMVCSGKEIRMDDDVGLDVSGRGCGADQGYETQGRAAVDPFTNACGAGGGSNIGAGGFGGKFTDSELTPNCSYGAKPFPDPGNGTLRTRSATGGIAKPRKENMWDFENNMWSWVSEHLDSDFHDLASRAGGLIWMSSSFLNFGGKVSLHADGMPGDVLSVPKEKKYKGIKDLVTGGGAGGQIVLFARDVNATSVTLSVRGGDYECSEDKVSGAGGGGFIGWGYLGTHRMKHRTASAFSVSTSGGNISKSCKLRLPKEGRERLVGGDGVSLPLDRCAAGRQGLFCSPCPPGTYNDGNSSYCVECNNKPQAIGSFARYSEQEGWPNASCPYVCSAEVPNILSNPRCLNAMDYALSIYGGRTRLLSVMGGLFLAAVFLVWYRASCCQAVLSRKQKQTGSFISRPSSSFIGRASIHEGEVSSCWSCLSWMSGLCNRCCERWRPSLRSVSDSGTIFIFRKEDLPYHIGRVFLYGGNVPGNPWSLDSNVPAFLEELVSAEQWEHFAKETTAASSISSMEAYCVILLRYIYPPAKALFSLRGRRRRSKKLKGIAHRSSQAHGNHGRVVLWRTVRAGELTMTFGCDRGATLGYLDFFDFSRDQLDWAPADLSREPQVLVAHGHGTYSEPFALDAKDPALLNLVHSGLAPKSIYTVISQFNKLARVIPAFEIGCSHSKDMIEHLVIKVNLCAARCGLGNFVKVVVMPVSKASMLEVPPAQTPPDFLDSSFSDLIRLQPVPRMASLGEQPSSFEVHLIESESPDDQHVASFGSRQPAPDSQRAAKTSWHMLEMFTGGISFKSFHRRPSCGSDCTPGRAVPHQSAMSQQVVEARLCLVFSSSPCPDDKVTHSTSSDTITSHPAVSSSPASLKYTLTSPMPSLSDQMMQQLHLEWTKSSASSTRDHDADDALESLFAECLFSSRLCIWRGSFRGSSLGSAAPSTVLLLLMVLFFADTMVFFLICSILTHLGNYIFAMYLLVPPLTQPLGAITGVVFAFGENIRIGRLFATATAYSIANQIVLWLLLLYYFRGSWHYDTLMILIACILKVALFTCANVHISNLEIAHDLSFVEGQAQVDFMNRQLSPSSHHSDRPFQARESTLELKRSSPLQPSFPGTDSPSHSWSRSCQCSPDAKDGGEASAQDESPEMQPTKSHAQYIAAPAHAASSQAQDFVATPF